MAELSQLDKVRLDAERITRERIEAEAKAKAWQVAQKGGVSLDESVEAAKAEVEEPKPKTVKAKKDK